MQLATELSGIYLVSETEFISVLRQGYMVCLTHTVRLLPPRSLPSPHAVPLLYFPLHNKRKGKTFYGNNEKEENDFLTTFKGVRNVLLMSNPLLLFFSFSCVDGRDVKDKISCNKDFFKVLKIGLRRDHYLKFIE